MFPSLYPPPGEPGSPHRTASETHTHTHSRSFVRCHGMKGKAAMRPVQEAYADTAGRLPSTSRSPHRSTRLGSTAGSRGNSCSSRRLPRSGRFPPLCRDALEAGDHTGWLQQNRCFSLSAACHRCVNPKSLDSRGQRCANCTGLFIVYSVSQLYQIYQHPYGRIYVCMKLQKTK